MTAPSVVSTTLRAMSSPTARVAPASVALAADTRYGPAVVAWDVATAPSAPPGPRRVAGTGPVGDDWHGRAAGAGHRQRELLPGRGFAGRGHGDDGPGPRVPLGRCDRGVGRRFGGARHLARALVVHAHGAGVGPRHGRRAGDGQAVEAVDPVLGVGDADRTPEEGGREPEYGHD